MVKKTRQAGIKKKIKKHTDQEGAREGKGLREKINFLKGRYISLESANIFCNGPHSKYFLLCRPVACLISITATLCHWTQKASIDNMEMNEYGCVPIKLYLQKLMLGQV